jgi:hypothetical protein
VVDAQFQPPPRAGVEEAGFDVVSVRVEVEFDCVPVVEDISPRPIYGLVDLCFAGCRVVPVADAGYFVVRAAARIIRSVGSRG